MADINAIFFSHSRNLPAQTPNAWAGLGILMLREFNLNGNDHA